MMTNRNLYHYPQDSSPQTPKGKTPYSTHPLTELCFYLLLHNYKNEQVKSLSIIASELYSLLFQLILFYILQIVKYKEDNITILGSKR